MIVNHGPGKMETIITPILQMRKLRLQRLSVAQPNSQEAVKLGFESRLVWHHILYSQPLCFSTSRASGLLSTWLNMHLSHPAPQGQDVDVGPHQIEVKGDSQVGAMWCFGGRLGGISMHTLGSGEQNMDAWASLLLIEASAWVFLTKLKSGQIFFLPGVRSLLCWLKIQQRLI